MTRWARLTWQVTDPADLAARLEDRLGVPGVPGAPGGLVPGAVLLDLGSAVLEVRPWVREGPHDRPRAAGRLVLEPVPGGEPEPEPAGGPDPEARAPDPPASGAVTGAPPPGPVLAGIGWCTVELDRSADELDMWLGPPPAVSGSDPHLGAVARLRPAGSLPAEWIVLLEPSTEGRVAASLARDGEGPCALYLRPPGDPSRAALEAWLAGAAARGLRTTGGLREGGPFGVQALVAGSPPSGPHVLIVEGRSPAPSIDAAGTIAP